MARYDDDKYRKRPSQPYLLRVPGKPGRYIKNPDWDGNDDDETLTRAESEVIGSGSFGDDKEPNRAFLQRVKRTLGAHAPVNDYPLEADDNDPLLELLDLYSNLNFYAERQRDYHKRLDTLLRLHPKLLQQWAKFQRVGGSTTKDLEDFLNGHFRPRITRQRKHLRLVATRKVIPLRLRKPGSNDAA